MNFSNFGFWDVGFTKLAVLSATLFLVSAWPTFAKWVTGTHWAWFLIPGILLAIKPWMKVFKK
jgi:hypothetical protein